VKTQILPRTELTFTYWWLNLTSELVFNGDEARSNRAGRAAARASSSA